MTRSGMDTGLGPELPKCRMIMEVTTPCIITTVYTRG